MADSPLSALTASTGPDYSKVVDQNIWEPLQSQTAASVQLPNLVSQMQAMPQMLSPQPQQPPMTQVQAPSPMRFQARPAAPGGGAGVPSGPAYSGNAKGAALLRDAASKAGFTGDALNMAVAIGMAESGGNPAATNTAGNSAGTDRGLWQINDFYHKDMFSQGLNWQDPYANARAAYQISGGGKNWGPWSTYGSGAYRKFLGG